MTASGTRGDLRDTLSGVYVRLRGRFEGSLSAGTQLAAEARISWYLLATSIFACGVDNPRPDGGFPPSGEAAARARVPAVYSYLMKCEVADKSQKMIPA